MFRHSFIALFALGLPAAISGAETGPDVVNLPDYLVRVAPDAASGHPTTVELDATPSRAPFSNLLRQIAGLAVNDAGARSFGQTITLRGLGNTPYFSDPSVVVYLDDIPLAGGFTFPTEAYDFNRMTVYRGPQAGAQFGRAGDAGVIQLTSPRAGSGESHAGGSAGSYAWRAFNAGAFNPSGKQSDVSIEIGASQRDGYITNTTLHRTVDDQESIFGRALMRYRPADDWAVSLQFLGQRARDGAEALVPLGGPWFEVQRGKEGATDTDFSAVALGVSRHATGGTFHSATSLVDWNLPRFSNELVVFGGLNLDSALTQSQRTFNQEFRFDSDRISAGAFFSRARTDGEVGRSISGFAVEKSSFDLSGDTFALFGRANFKPGDDWRVTPGLRYENAGKDFTRREFVPATSLITRNDRWDAILPSLAVTWSLGANSDLTVTLARGFKPGGYSAYTDRADLAAYNSQRTWGAEASYAVTDPDSKWSVVSRAYAYRVQGYQIERSFAVPNAPTDEYLVVNAGRARVLGFEFESAWRPTTAFAIRATAGLTDATLADFTDPFTHENYSGSRVPCAPSGNAVLQIDYRPARGFFAGAGLTWTGKTYFDEHETAAFSQAGYALLGARAGYGFPRGQIGFYGRNLTGKNYYSSITPGVFHGTPGAPFTWGVDTSWRW